MQKTLTLLKWILMLGLLSFALNAVAAVMTVIVTNVTQLSGKEAVHGCIRNEQGWPKWLKCTSNISGQGQTASYVHTENKYQNMSFKFSLTDALEKFVLSSRCASQGPGGVTTGKEANGFFAIYKIDISNDATAKMQWWYNSAQNPSQGGTLDCLISIT